MADPCVFNEPGTDDYYMIAGVFEYYVTRLGKDMVSLAEKPRHITFTNHVYGPCGDGKTDDKPFMHKNGDVYYLSWGCFYATSKSVYGPFEMQGSVIDTAKIAPEFRCDGEAHQCGKADVLGVSAVSAPQLARAAALAQYDRPAVPGIPRAGEPIMLVKCSDASAAAIGWTQRHGAAKWRPGAPFQISLTANQSLCIEAHAPMHAGGSGEHLTLQKCDERRHDSDFKLRRGVDADARGKLQMFSRNTTVNGDDITGPVAGPQHCPCWNVNVANPTHPSEPDSALSFVQCETCVDGAKFNTNQRFAFPASGGPGQIQAWQGWAVGYCVAAQPPPAKPWFLSEDHTDRHGSFLSHGGQWYFFSNDRSHSGDVGHEGVFRDTVGCYIHFRANGTMESCVINAQGVNTHDLALGIEAENFFSLEGGEKIDLQHAGGGDGFAVGGGDGVVLRYPHVIGLSGAAALTLRVATALTSRETSLELRANSATGPILGSCGLPSTGSSFVVVVHRVISLLPTLLPTLLPADLRFGHAGGLSAFTNVSCALDTVVYAELDQLVVIAKGAIGGELFRLDRFSL
jgi:hypothetical protein